MVGHLAFILYEPFNTMLVFALGPCGPEVNQERMVHLGLLDQLEKKATKVLKESKVKDTHTHTHKTNSWLFFTEGELFSVHTERRFV